MKVVKLIKRHPVIAIVGGVIIIAILSLVYLRIFENRDWADWTGLAAYTAPDGTYYPTKGLWDFLELLIIPVVIGIGAALFNWQQKVREQDMAQDRQQEEALQSYLDKMAELMLKDKLLEKKDSEDDPVVDVAQIRTVTTLRILDKDRRNILTQFLRDANLASFILKGATLNEANLENTMLYNINLTRSDLTKACLIEAFLVGSHLIQANLAYARLDRAYMVGANLSQAILACADLSGAVLSEAYMSEAVLIEANLSKAVLMYANLGGSNLSGADLSMANLKGARGLTEEQLATVKSLKGTTMPDGTIHE